MDVTQRYNNGLKSHSKIPNPKRQTNAKRIRKFEIRNPKTNSNTKTASRKHEKEKAKKDSSFSHFPDFVILSFRFEF